MTAEMLELFRRNHHAGVLLVYNEPKDNPNKYNMH
jgi:hypothetical protein